jgi:hypothetical protein
MGAGIYEKCELYVYNYHDYVNYNHHDFINYNHHVNDSSIALAAT